MAEHEMYRNDLELTFPFELIRGSRNHESPVNVRPAPLATSILARERYRLQSRSRSAPEQDAC